MHEKQLNIFDVLGELVEASKQRAHQELIKAIENAEREAMSYELKEDAVDETPTQCDDVDPMTLEEWLASEDSDEYPAEQIAEPDLSDLAINKAVRSVIMNTLTDTSQPLTLARAQSIMTIAPLAQGLTR